MPSLARTHRARRRVTLLLVKRSAIFGCSSIWGAARAGHVFLASQPSLGDRPVVVKLTTFHGQEHLTLARLQHTNIVPLYAVVDDAVRKLRILCMPYFGGVTLDVLLDKLADLPPRDRNLPHVIANLRTASALATGPATKILEQLSFEKSICWICLNLAEALHYAHDPAWFISI